MLPFNHHINQFIKLMYSPFILSSYSVSVIVVIYHIEWCTRLDFSDMLSMTSWLTALSVNGPPPMCAHQIIRNMGGYLTNTNRWVFKCSAFSALETRTCGLCSPEGCLLFYHCAECVFISRSEVTSISTGQTLATEESLMQCVSSHHRACCSFTFLQ